MTSAKLLLGVFLVMVAHSALANDIREVRVHFPQGKTGATIKGHLKGYEIVDYKLGARAGQRMVVNLQTDNASNYFNVMEPGETEEAIFIGSSDGNRFKDELSKSGDYTVRVYLMRNAARRNEVAKYKLDIEIAVNAKQPAAGSGDALVPGTNFNATGQVPCALQSGQPMGSCQFGVQRKGGGSAVVTVFWPDGRSRAIFFENGKATGADVSEADSTGDFRVERDSDLNMIHVGKERYEIPDVVVYGD